jgi:hypothetical protein
MLVRVRLRSTTKDRESTYLFKVRPPETPLIVPTDEPRTDEEDKPIDLLLSQLTEAQVESTEALRNFRSFGTEWYERQWVKVMAKYERLLTELSMRRRKYRE